MNMVKRKDLSNINATMLDSQGAEKISVGVVLGVNSVIKQRMSAQKYAS
jgi:hypothetical protein